MHSQKIRFEGYRRLASTSCNSDGKILAFVGSNESGKSSMLEGLVWLTDGENEPLAAKIESRTHEVADNTVVVEAIFELDADDLAYIQDLDLQEQPASFVLQKRKNGVRAFGLRPVPKRNPTPFRDAAMRLATARRRLSKQFSQYLDEDADASDRPVDLADVVLAALEDPDVEWSDEALSAAEVLADWLEGVPSTSRSGKPRDTRAAEALRSVLAKARSGHPAETARIRLRQRVPEFLLFKAEDRDLSTVHQIDSEADRSGLQPAFRNLLRIAGLDIDQLWRYVESGNDSSRETRIEEANTRLESFFTQAWNQSNVSVRLKISDNRLEVYLKELRRGGAITNIEERSDGLRTFVALAAFLASQELEIPPILLIDEAETHLHYDAQADLVGALLPQVNATQVFYTTHSPGCLPSDLGTGIRLLSQDPSHPGESLIRSDFWTNEEPGFAPLLYAMGASAAAFSVCRRAVLAEGAADMILLPTLIRMATGSETLDYQIAPGLANAHAFGMNTSEVAAQVVYLTDGDSEGKAYRKRLLDVGVDAEHVFSLPDGWASEDLVSHQTYVAILNTLLPQGVLLTEKDLGKRRPIVKAFDEWARQQQINPPGHVAIAYGLVNQRRRIELARGAKEVLSQLHAEFSRVFDSTALQPKERGGRALESP